jgi:hypothetical protein
MKNEKIAKNGRKVKAIALLFCCFLVIYKKWEKSLKVDEKYLKGYIAFTFRPFLAYFSIFEKEAKNNKK